jgi:hypothetical protein
MLDKLKDINKELGNNFKRFWSSNKFLSKEIHHLSNCKILKISKYKVLLKIYKLIQLIHIPIFTGEIKFHYEIHIFMILIEMIIVFILKRLFV